jgi:hypothetical protein
MQPDNESREEMTSSEPYQPSFDNAGDAAEVMRGTKPGSHRRSAAPRTSTWEPPQGRRGRSLMPPLDPEFARRIEEFGRKLDRGEPLSVDELTYVVHRGYLSLVDSPRPRVAKAAIKALEDLASENREPPPPASDYTLNLP